MPIPFTVDPDPARATTLPPAFYLDPAVFAAVRDRVFARSWQWVGDLAAVQAPGSLAPRLLLPGLLDEPLLLARDEHGVLRGLSNVCTHRGRPLVDAACAARDIRCPYHGRRFALSGRMTSMPGFDGVPDFPADTDHLPALPFDSWQGHGFAAAEAPSLPLADWLAPVARRLAWLPLAQARHDPTRDRDFEVAAHWALYVENYLEGLHIPFLHAALRRTLDMAQYRYELHAGSNLQLALAAPGEPAFEPPAGALEQGQRVAAYYWWLFPNLMLNFYPWGLSLNLVQPLAPDRTRVSFRAYVLDAGLLDRGAGGALDRVEQEDEAAVEAVQRGLRARAFRGGRYSPQHERGVHQFHRLLCEALAT